MKTIFQKLLLLFQNNVFKWFLVACFIFLFSGVSITALHGQPVYVVVFFSIIVWAFLLPVLILVSKAEHDNLSDDPRDEP
jgi:hypothetical protein